MLREYIDGRISLPETLTWLAAIILALAIHESAHALASYWLGDSTAKEMGRVSLNPLRHIDPVGFLMLLLFGYGWAKPVMIDTRYYKNPKRDMAISAAAGPLSNFLLAFICMIVYRIISIFATGAVGNWFFIFFYFCALINVGLGVFNLFPVPPLDGSKVFGALLPDRLYYSFMRLNRYGMLIMIAILALGWLDGPLATLRSGVFNGLDAAAAFLTGWMGG